MKEEQLLSMKKFTMFQEIFVNIPTVYGKSSCYHCLLFLSDISYHFLILHFNSLHYNYNLSHDHKLCYI